MDPRRREDYRELQVEGRVYFGEFSCGWIDTANTALEPGW
jgi:hypothetical protein